MSTFGHIYALLDPRDQAVRYVGFSIDVKRRREDHCMPERDGITGHRDHWLRTLKYGMGLLPEMRILQEVDEHDWQEAERWWITFMRSQGCNLTNATDGGEGTLGHVFTDEQRENLRVAVLKSWADPNRKRPDESDQLTASRQRGGLATRGVPKPKGFSQKLSVVARNREKSSCELCGKPMTANGMVLHMRAHERKASMNIINHSGELATAF